MRSVIKNNIAKVTYNFSGMYGIWRKTVERKVKEVIAKKVMSKRRR